MALTILKNGTKVSCVNIYAMPHPKTINNNFKNRQQAVYIYLLITITRFY